MTRLKNTFQRHGARKTATPDIPIKEHNWSVISQLLSQRIIRLDGEVNDESAAAITSAIKYLETRDSKKEIHFFINSGGGYVHSGNSMIQAMKNCPCPIFTYAHGTAQSMAVDILLAGDKRYAVPNTKIMIHQPMDALEGQETHVRIYAEDLRRERALGVQFYAEQTGLRHEDIDKMIERDKLMPPEEAKALGIIDDVMDQKLFFKMFYNTAVPEHKKARYPGNVLPNAPRLSETFSKETKVAIRHRDAYMAELRKKEISQKRANTIEKNKKAAVKKKPVKKKKAPSAKR